jgi:TPR repeat protein
MAHKTNDPAVQLTYAKYLLEIASLYDTTRRPFRPNLSLTLSRVRRESFSSNLTSDSRCSSIESHVTATTPSSDDDDDEPPSKLKKKKMLEEEGVRWIKRLAKSRQGEAAYLLGLWYDRGMYGLRKSQTRALKFYAIASKQKVPEAMFAIGQQHERNQEYMTSFQLYEEAASLGLVEALYVSNNNNNNQQKNS